MKLFATTLLSLIYSGQLLASDFPTGVFTCQVETEYCSEFKSTGFPLECQEGSKISVEINSLQMGSKSVPYIVYKTSFYNEGEGYNPYFSHRQEGLGNIDSFSSAADPVLTVRLPSVINIQFLALHQ